MVSKKDKNAARIKRHTRVRAKISGTSERPRLAVYRSTNNISAQIIDDVKGNTLFAASTVEKDIAAQVAEMDKKAAAKLVGKVVAERAVAGGVNDTLAEELGLAEVRPFGPEGEQIGRIGVLPAPVSLDEFAATVCRVTEAKAVRVADGGRPVHHVAVLGGGGADEVGAAMAAGADTYLTGEFKHHNLTDAPDLGINLIEGGHFHTENPVCRRIEEMLRELDPTVTVDLMISDAVRILG